MRDARAPARLLDTIPSRRRLLRGLRRCDDELGRGGRTGERGEHLVILAEQGRRRHVLDAEPTGEICVLIDVDDHRLETGCDEGPRIGGGDRHFGHAAAGLPGGDEDRQHRPAADPGSLAGPRQVVVPRRSRMDDRGQHEQDREQGHRREPKGRGAAGQDDDVRRSSGSGHRSSLGAGWPPEAALGISGLFHVYRSKWSEESRGTTGFCRPGGSPPLPAFRMLPGLPSGRTAHSARPACSLTVCDRIGILRVLSMRRLRGNPVVFDRGSARGLRGRLRRKVRLGGIPGRFAARSVGFNGDPPQRWFARWYVAVSAGAPAVRHPVHGTGNPSRSGTHERSRPRDTERRPVRGTYNLSLMRDQTNSAPFTGATWSLHPHRAGAEAVDSPWSC